MNEQFLLVFKRNLLYLKGRNFREMKLLQNLISRILALSAKVSSLKVSFKCDHIFFAPPLNFTADLSSLHIHVNAV